jgi:hypothetical protein
VSLAEEPVAARGVPRGALGYRIAPGLSWSAIFAGATVSLALSLLLMVLAAGFGMQIGAYGLASRASLNGFTPVVGAWAIVAQVLPAALGGYLAGRLRHGWHGVHDDEAHFRDTAQGLIAWAVSALGGVLLVVLLLSPYAEHLAGADAAASLTPAQAVRAANISAQASYFAAVGMLVSAFVSAVAARLGGLRTEEMHPLV